MNRLLISLMFVSLLASGSVLAVPQAAGTKSAPSPATDHAGMQMDGMKMDGMQMEPTAADKAEFDKLDSNHDGKVSKAELPAKNPMSAHFGMLDADKDRSLTLAEFVSLRGM